MKISTKGRYGLRLMLDLAQQYSNNPISLKDIATRQNLSDKYLEQIITPLNRAGLVKSIRGAQGGYKLARSPKEITVGEVLRVLEGQLLIVPCTDENSKFCEKTKFCKTYPLWCEVKQAIENIVDNKTLAQLINNETKSQKD